VETRSKMGHARVNMIYESAGDGYRVSCPLQTAPAARTRTHWKADFKNDICRECPHSEHCPTVQRRRKRTLYFEESWAKASIRSRNIELIPEERWKLRANVEATVNEFTGCFNHKGKLRVRGLARSTLQILAAGLAINFGRVFRFQNRGLVPCTPQPNRQNISTAPFARVRASLSAILALLRPKSTNKTRHLIEKHTQTLSSYYMSTSVPCTA
ncbi:transposase, partial [Gemmatimonadota bacterium]